MATLAVSREFLPDYAALDKAVRAKVDQVFPKFTEHTHAGLHLEKMFAAKDPRVRTIRIDDNFRGIVMAPDKGDTYLLVRVLPHDESDKWVARNRFSVNTATGALEIVDVTGIETIAEAIPPPGADGKRGLLADRSVKDFTRLGLPESLVPILRRIVDESELEGLAAVLPPRQADALTALAAGFSIEEAWAELVAGDDPGPVDIDDVDAALGRRASSDRFRVVDGAEELRDILSRPFDLWRVFLHPTQRRLAYRERYNGPVRVSGGAGTGKTVVAMHRAKALADLQPDGPRTILFTTFTRNLSSVIEHNLKVLGGPALLNRVEVANIDRLAWRIVNDHEGTAPKVLADDDETRLCDDVVDELGGPWTAAFLLEEWRQVILSQGISSRNGYLTAARPGRGVRLSRRQRVEVWRLIEELTNRLVAREVRSHLQLADAAAGYLAGRTIKPFEHLIVDEAQDLHPAQWRLLRALAPEAANDLFLVGDTHQRIYDNRVTLGSLGIKVTGRSFRLRLNQRTTDEILRFSLGLLTGEHFDDLDAGEDTAAGYHSETHGAGPVVEGFATKAEEAAALVAAVRVWLDSGVAPSEIGIAARTADGYGPFERALQRSAIPVRVLTASQGDADEEAVAVATMHRMKGLEFRCVAVVDAGRDVIPLPYAMTPASEDPVQHDHDLQRERCLVYVACTRAREQLRLSWSGRPSPLLVPTT